MPSEARDSGKANCIYLTATLDEATWGAELAAGGGPGRTFRVDPQATGTLRARRGESTAAKDRHGTAVIPRPRKAAGAVSVNG